MQHNKRRNSFFDPGRMRLMRTCVLGRYVASTVSIISTRTFRRAPTASVDSCAEIYRVLLDGVTSSGSIWRKVPESEALSVQTDITLNFTEIAVCKFLRGWRSYGLKPFCFVHCMCLYIFLQLFVRRIVP